MSCRAQPGTMPNRGRGTRVATASKKATSTSEGEEETAMDALRGHSNHLPHRARSKGKDARRLPCSTDGGEGAMTKAAGFSLHAGVAAAADERSNGTGYAATSPAPPFPRAAVTDASRSHPLPAENALSRWYYPRRVRAARLHRQAGGSCSEAAGASHPVPRGVRAR